MALLSFCIPPGAITRDQIRHTSIECPVEAALEIVGGKWKLVILEHLTDGVLRFGELRRTMPAITARMLTRQLRELEADGLVLRTVYAQVPPKVEYSLTDIGRSLKPLLGQLRSWGEWYRRQSSGAASFDRPAAAPPAHERDPGPGA